MIWISALLAALLAGIHVFAGRLRFLDREPRSIWLSGAGGVSVAYVFVHILPDLAAYEAKLRTFTEQYAGFVEHHVYILALLGLAVFYGLERMAKASRARSRQQGQADVTQPGVFWIHITSFGIYNALIGYLLLHRERPGVASLLLFFAAMATHFLINDFGLRRDHKFRYDRYGRWLIAAGILVGWAVGALERAGWIRPVHPALIAGLFAFLAGGVVLNVLKEELPEERQSNFWAFAVGTAGYAALLLVI